LKSLKDGFEEQEEFLESLYPLIESLLKEIDHKTYDLELKTLQQDLEQTLADRLGMKARRTRANNGKHGTVKPAETGPNHKDAKDKQPDKSGNMPGSDGRGIRVYFSESDAPWLCRIDGSRTKVTATINLRHPLTKTLKRNTESLLQVIIMHLVAFEQNTQGGQLEFAFSEVTELTSKDRFERIVGEMLRRETVTE
jgi:hypothetical protein